MTGIALRVGTFGGASAFPLRVAQLLGGFADAGLDVDLEQTTDSQALRAGLAEGRLHVVHLAPDNVIAWRDGSATQSSIPVRAWLAGSNGPITLVARTAADVAGLRGARIGVDAPGSGFAPILRRILALGGLGDTDVRLVALGATRRRAEALAAGDIDASMLTLPWSRLAEEAGATAIADHRAVAPGLLTSCGASLDGWLAADHGRIARAYAGAVDRALAWLQDPSSTAQAVAWFEADAGLGEATATAVLAVMRDPELGWPAATTPHDGALDAVWRLRAEAVGEPAAPADAYLRLAEDRVMRRWRGVSIVGRIWLGIRAGSFTWIVPEQVGAARYPRDAAALTSMAGRGVRLLVNLHEKPIPAADLTAAGLRAVHLPVPDFTPPSPEQLRSGVAAIDAALAAGERVAVHCGAGLGRTGTLIAAWLVTQGRTPDTAIAEVRARRPGSIETDAQQDAVRAFAVAHAAPDPASPASTAPPGGPA